MDKEKHNCDNVNCNHNDTKGLCCLFNPDNCKYRQLQKENAELHDNYEQYKAVAEPEIKSLKDENSKLRDSLDYASLSNTELASDLMNLQKENAELKETVIKMNKVITETFSNLTKAKELLKKWVELYKPKLEGYPITPIQEETENFLKDSEMEK